MANDLFIFQIANEIHLGCPTCEASSDNKNVQESTRYDPVLGRQAKCWGSTDTNVVQIDGRNKKFSSRPSKWFDLKELFLYNGRINKTVRPFYPPPTIR